MDAADEKLTALKKAYADIILSISKEAAARVMVSERKLVRYQHELKIAKEEGVRMLMRLKQMMDSQISEAEASALNQQNKIDELEAQLQEAEDIVRDLREELEEVQAELERLKSENSNNLNGPSNAYSSEIHVDNNISSHQSCKYPPPIESSVGSDACDVYIRNRDLPSIIVRGKDPGLYRNGCTQRIRACEWNALDGDLCLSEEARKLKDEKNEGEQKEGAKMPSELEKKMLAEINLGTFKSFARKKKRAFRQRKTVILLGGKQCDSSPKTSLSLEHSLTRKTVILLGGKQCGSSPKTSLSLEHSLTSDTVSANDNAHSAENPSMMCPTFFHDKAELQTQLPSEKDSENEINIMEIDGAKAMHGDKGESEKLVVPLRRVSGLPKGLQSPDCKMDVEKADVPSGSLESNLSAVTIGERVIKYTFQRKRKRHALSGNEITGSSEIEKKTGEGRNGNQQLEQPKPSLVEESLGDRRQCRSDVNGSCETEKKTGDGKIVDQQLEQPKPSLVEELLGDRRQCRSEVKGFCETEKKTGDGQCADQKVEQTEPSLLQESSRDRRRLAQVARQLISLSEKKWWH